MVVTERDTRLRAVQDYWHRVRQAIAARSGGDYRAMMATGVVCRRFRQVRQGKRMRLIEEFEIDTGAIGALNAIEKGAAIETGQDQPDGPDRCPFDAK